MTKQPNWYINSSTGLVILKDGSIVEWENYKKVVSVHVLNNYLDEQCDCYDCLNIKKQSRKRRASTDASEYYAYSRM
jgi:hypothetical protein